MYSPERERKIEWWALFGLILFLLLIVFIASAFYAKNGSAK